MRMTTYPQLRVVKIAKEVACRARSSYASILSDARFHDLDDLKRYCKQINARLIENWNLPGTKAQAAVIKVDEKAFVILDRSLQGRRFESICSLAHEMSHIMLGHLRRESFPVLGFSETMDKWDADFQIIYHTETELEANLLAMMLVIPDSYLDRIVEQMIYIPAESKANEHDLSTDWVAARIQLYRQMYGYERSRELLRERADDRISQPDFDKWFSLEFEEYNCLDLFLPKIDARFLRYIS